MERLDPLIVDGLEVEVVWDIVLISKKKKKNT